MTFNNQHNGGVKRDNNISKVTVKGKGTDAENFFSCWRSEDCILVVDLGGKKGR